MTVRILAAGLQTTIQAAPRVGLRHLGVPTSGAADPLSMALANKLVGNAAATSCLEVTLSGMSFEVSSDVTIAITGAVAQIRINDGVAPQHESLDLNAGDRVVLGPAERGARCYVAFAGGLCADGLLGSYSTYLPAALGGYGGRSLKRDDMISFVRPRHVHERLQTPPDFRPPMCRSWTIRTSHAAETNLLIAEQAFFDSRFIVGSRNDRMGIEMERERVEIRSEGRFPSSPVFPGTIQCPENGKPILLSVDAQTTGGYPRVAQVVRADRHLIGQLRQGDSLRLLLREYDDAVAELRGKHVYWREWLPDVADVV